MPAEHDCLEQGRFKRLEARAHDTEEGLRDVREDYQRHKGESAANAVVQRGWNERMEHRADRHSKRIGKVETSMRA